MVLIIVRCGERTTAKMQLVLSLSNGNNRVVISPKSTVGLPQLPGWIPDPTDIRSIRKACFQKLFPENTVGKLQGERNGHTATQTNRILYIISHLYAEIFIKLIVKMSYDTQLYPVTITFLQIYLIKFIHHTPRIREKFSR